VSKLKKLALYTQRIGDITIFTNHNNFHHEKKKSVRKKKLFFFLAKSPLTINSSFFKMNKWGVGGSNPIPSYIYYLLSLPIELSDKIHC